MDIKIIELGEIHCSMRNGQLQVRVNGAQAAVNFTNSGLVDGVIGMNPHIPLDTEATVTVKGADITLTAEEIARLLYKLVKPVIRADAIAQVTVGKKAMPAEVAD